MRGFRFAGFVAAFISLLTSAVLVGHAPAPSSARVFAPPSGWGGLRTSAGPAPLPLLQSQAAGPDYPVGAPALNPRNEPAVAVNPRDPKHVVVAAHDRIDGRSGVSAWSSKDGGRTFGTPRMMPAPPEAQREADASVGFDSRGTAFVGYLVYNPRPTDVGGIYVARSSDGATGWKTTKVASNSLEPKSHEGVHVGCVFQDKSYLTVDTSKDPLTQRPRNWVYITWQEINYADGQCTEFALERIMVARSTDGGRTFQAPVQISAPKKPFDFGAMPYVAPSGDLYVAYVSLGSSTCAQYSLDIKLARSTNGGRTFAHSTAAPGICGVSRPSRTGSLYRQNSLPSLTIHPKDGTLAIAWANDDGPNQSIRIRTSRDQGRSWIDAGSISPLPGILQFPWLAYSPDGKILAVTYIDHVAGGVFDAYLAFSKDDARTWSEPMRLSTASSQAHAAGFIGDYNGMAIGRDGVAHPVWTDIRTPSPVGAQNIWTRPVKL